MVWDDKYLIGIKEIDDQHKQLVKIITKFKDALSDKTLDIVKEMGSVIVFLVNYANYHFEAEEALMERIGYPDLDLHKRVHADLITKLKEVLLKLKSKKSYTPIEFYYFLMNWITQHIEDEDEKVGKYYKLSKRGAKPANTSLEDSEYVVSVFEPNINKLKLLVKNKLITSEDEYKKKMDFITRFYRQYEVSSVDSLLLTLSSINVLLEKEFISEVEHKEALDNIIADSKLDELLIENRNVEKSLEALKYLVESELVTSKYYEDMKSQLIEVI